MYFVGNLVSGEDQASTKKRKDVEDKDDEILPEKKSRVVWTVDLHQKFLQAVDQIGIDKVGPTKIHDLMNVPWLTTENVKNHLQKYRLYLGRMEKYKDSKPLASGMKYSNLPLMGSVNSFALGFPGSCSTAAQIKHTHVSLTESVCSFGLSLSGSCSTTMSITATEFSSNSDASKDTRCSVTNINYLYSYKKVRQKYVSDGGHESEGQEQEQEQEHEDEVVSKLAVAPNNASSMDIPNPCSSAESKDSHSTSSESSAGPGAFDSTFLFRKSHNGEDK